MLDYDEAKEFDRYVNSNMRSLMTPMEWEAYTLAVLQEKTRLSTKLASYDGLQERLAAKEAGASEEVRNLVAEGGFVVFQQEIIDRLKNELLAGQLLLNRCPGCNRIVKTPLARQCLWCGYDWHIAVP